MKNILSCILDLAEKNEIYAFENDKLENMLYLKNLKKSIVKNIHEYIIPVLNAGSSYIIRNEDLFPTVWLSIRMKKKREEYY